MERRLEPHGGRVRGVREFVVAAAQSGGARHRSCIPRGMPTSMLQEFLRRLEAEDPLELGPGVRWTAARLEERRFSSIHVLRTAAHGDAVRQRTGGHELILKHYHAAQPVRRQREFDDLQSVWTALGEAGRSARPVACWAADGVLVTARVSGAPLGDAVRRTTLRTGDADGLAQTAAACTAAGAWLRTFQRRAPQSVREMRAARLDGPEAFVAYLDERLRILGEVHPRVESALRNRLLAHAAATLHALPPRVFQDVTWSHSDFGPHNVLAGAEGIHVIDFELAPQHPAFDAAYFVESLAHRVGPWVDPARVRRLERAFLAGYGEPLDPAMFALLRLRHLVCSYVSEGRRGGIASLRGWPGLVAMRGRLRHMAEVLSRRSRARAA